MPLDIASDSASGSAGVLAAACETLGSPTQHGKSRRWKAQVFQLAAREGQAGPSGMAERLVVPMKPGNAGRGKGPQFRGGAESSRETAIGASLATRLMLAGRGRHPMPATAWHPVREPDAGDPHVRFDERDVETEHGSARLGTGNRKGRQRLCAPKPPRHISTLREMGRGGDGETGRREDGRTGGRDGGAEMRSCCIFRSVMTGTAKKKGLT